MTVEVKPVILTVEQFKEALQDNAIINAADLRLLQTFYYYDNNGPEIKKYGIAMGRTAYNPFGSNRLWKQIAKKFGLTIERRHFYDLLFNEEITDIGCQTVLKPELSKAMENLKLTGNKPISKDEWTKILYDRDVTEDINIEIFQVIYSRRYHQICGAEIGRELGIGGKAPQTYATNCGKYYAIRIQKKYTIALTKTEKGENRYWDVFFHGWHLDRNRFMWKLKPELIMAMEELGLTGEEQYFPDELPAVLEPRTFPVKMKKRITVNAYERDPKARKDCLKKWGYSCVVCGFDFEKFYGDLGREYVHVHHRTPISELAVSYEIDPINDLRPVCPNCHAMLHRKDSVSSIEELKTIVEINRLQ